jgi:hypothetical protein
LPKTIASSIFFIPFALVVDPLLILMRASMCAQKRLSCAFRIIEVHAPDRLARQN